MASKKPVKKAVAAGKARPREVGEKSKGAAGAVPKEAKIMPHEADAGDRGGGNEMKAMLLAVGAIAAVLVLIAYLLMSQGGGGKLPAFEDVASNMMGAIKELKTGTLDFEASVSMSAQGQQMSMGVESLVKFDLPAKKMYTGNSLSLGFAEQSMETYTIDKVSYMRADDPYTGQETWVKTEADMSMLDLSGLDADEVTGLLDGKVVGEGKINGKEAYKLEVDPDVAAIVEFIMRGQDLSSAGISQADLDNVVGELVNSVKRVDLTVWALKDSYLPIKAQGEVVMALDMDSMGDTGALLGVIDISISFTASADYEKTVVIELPEGAKEAQDASAIGGVAETSCGDGWCDWDENESSCPEDCTAVCGDGWCDWDENESSCPEDCAAMAEGSQPQLVGNDSDEHGCIGSAGYTWCESKQKCLRIWEEEC